MSDLSPTDYVEQARAEIRPRLLAAFGQIMDATYSKMIRETGEPLIPFVVLRDCVQRTLELLDLARDVAEGERVDEIPGYLFHTLPGGDNFRWGEVPVEVPVSNLMASALINVLAATAPVLELMLYRADPAVRDLIFEDLAKPQFVAEPRQ